MSVQIPDQQRPDWRDLIASKLAVQGKELEPFFIPSDRLPPFEQKRVLGFFDEEGNRDLLTELEREITNEPEVDGLRAGIIRGKWKCEDVVRGYIKRYAYACTWD